MRGKEILDLRQLGHDLRVEVVGVHCARHCVVGQQPYNPVGKRFNFFSSPFSVCSGFLSITSQPRKRRAIGSPFLSGLLARSSTAGFYGSKGGMHDVDSFYIRATVVTPLGDPTNDCCDDSHVVSCLVVEGQSRKMVVRAFNFFAPLL